MDSLHRTPAMGKGFAYHDVIISRFGHPSIIACRRNCFCVSLFPWWNCYSIRLRLCRRLAIWPVTRTDFVWCLDFLCEIYCFVPCYKSCIYNTCNVLSIICTFWNGLSQMWFLLYHICDIYYLSKRNVAWLCLAVINTQFYGLISSKSWSTT